MIRSFRDQHTEKVFSREDTRLIPKTLQPRALRKLLIIDAAEKLEELRIPPGNRLEKLKGDRMGQHSIRINRQFRICFVWQNANAFEVEIVDYH